MTKYKKKMQVKVRAYITPKLELRLGYFDNYEYVYEDIYDYVPPDERRSIGNLMTSEDEYVVTYVTMEAQDLCEVYDKLSIQYSEECKRLNDECEELHNKLQE